MNILLPCGHESESPKQDCLPCSKYATDSDFKVLCEKLNSERLNRQLPNIIERTGNFIKAGIRYAEAGMPAFLQEGLEQDRLRICSGCTENKDGVCVAINPTTGKACGCFVAAKSKIPTEDCPVGKWPKLNLPVITGKCGGCGKK